MEQSLNPNKHITVCPEDFKRMDRLQLVQKQFILLERQAIA